MSISQTIDPLLERFAANFSDEYSKTTDRKQQILDFVTGVTDQLPDVLKSSNTSAYRTIDTLEKLARKEHNDAFYRAASLVLYVSNDWKHYYYNNWYVMAMMLGDSVDKLTLLSRTTAAIDEQRAHAVLGLLVRYAGHDVIEKALQFLLSSSHLQAPSTKPKHQGDVVARLDHSIQLLLLIRYYSNQDEAYITTLIDKLPPLLQAVLREDHDRVEQQLDQTLRLLLLTTTQNKDNASELDLQDEWLQARRVAIWQQTFPGESFDSANGSMSREERYSELAYVNTAFFYLLKVYGGKSQLLAQSNRTVTAILHAIRALHESLPLELRELLTQLEARNTSADVALEGIVPLDEPYELLELIRSQFSRYVVWGAIRTAITAQPERARRAYDISSSSFAKVLIVKVLMEAGEMEPDQALLEQFVLDALEHKHESNGGARKLAKYLRGEFRLDSMHRDEQVRLMWSGKNNDPKLFKMMYVLSYLPVQSELMRRLLMLVTQSDLFTINALSNLYRSPFFKGSQVLEHYTNDDEINLDNLLSAMLQLQGHLEYQYISIPEPEYSEIVRSNIDKTLAQYTKLPLDGRTVVMETLLYEPLPYERLAYVLRLGLSDSSKRISNFARAQFVRLANAELYKHVYLHEKKAGIKEMVLNAIRSLPDASAIFNDLLQQEKSDTFYALLEVLSETANQRPEIAHAALAERADSKKLNSIDWLPVDKLPELTNMDGEKLANNANLKRYLLLQSLDHNSAPNEHLREVEQYASRASLADLSAALVELWLQHGAPAKQKWVLYLAVMFGDRRLIDLLGGQMKEWAENSRGAIAAEAVRVLAYLSDPAALMVIDKLSRTIKNRQVKTAALDSLQLAAENMNLTPEQLADRLVTTLGLDEQGEMTLSYGERTFTVKVGMDLQLRVISADTGKTVKSLPAPTAKDDAELAKAAKATFNGLKKDLKTMVTLQSQRLEQSLSKRRLWTGEQWKALFVGNMIMRQFAIGLIWGVYAAGQLTDTFRYMEDGTFNTVDEDEYEWTDEVEIGLVHPLELSSAQIAAWKQQLADYEVVQPFKQLERQTYELQEEQTSRHEWEAVPQGEYSPTGFPNALERYGWYKGRAEDGGFYRELFKQYDGIVAELQFSGTSITYYGEMDDITLETLRFIRTSGKGAWHKGYSSDTSIVLKHVPARMFSETVYDILRAAGQAD
ncbi:DUF4132 domain-containing protein [Paenibacillus campi]|uniref:DUF4132 domain-containing protein n=1 Tax=Paenibacillus campi TaxID=3106031 RepID=UPI002AFDC98F|nr:DUF4132 domain-containing protein [Paenibacillus sp. SGZ-1014]